MIYFIHAAEIGRVKIGYAKYPWARLSKMQSDCPCELVLLAFIEGDKIVERSLHQRFADYRHRGEWFTYDGELRAHIETLEQAPPKKPRKPSRLKEMASAAGMSRSYVHQIMSGKRASVQAVLHLCKTTDWRPAYWADMTDEQVRDLADKIPWKLAA